MTTADTQAAEQPVVQPIQQLSNLDKARAADTRTTIKLNAIQAYDELELFGTEAGTYSDNSSVQGEYWRFKFRGAICTVSTEFKKAYDEGTLLGLTATPTVFGQNRPDPNNAGKFLEIISLGWSLSFNDLAKLKKAQAAMAQASNVEFQIKKQEKIDAKKIEKLEAMDISELITDEEMKQLLSAAGA